MQELQDFLKKQKIYIKNSFIEEKKIKDIFLWRKKFNQKVTFEVIQKKLDQEETLLKHKKEISRATQFSPEDYNIGDHTIKGVEPGSYTTDDCLTCDGHWEITCPTCGGTGEIKCPHCNGKGQIKKKRVEYKQQIVACSTCNGTGTASYTCSNCNGKGQIQSFQTCPACKGMRKIQTGIHPTTKLPLYTPCSSCNASWRIVSFSSCGVCGGSWKINWMCKSCGGKGSKTQNIPIEIEYLEPCKHCNGSGRLVCPTCHGQQNITCPTCHWERRTIQYEYNTFQISVTPRYELIMNKDITDIRALKTIALAKKKKLEYLLIGEKEALKKKSVDYKMKINEKTTSRIEGTLYVITIDEEKYYIYQNRENFYCLELPPTSKFESYVKKQGRKVEKFWIKTKDKVIDKLINFLTNRKEY